MADILQRIDFKDIYFIFIQISLKFAANGPIDNNKFT